MLSISTLYFVVAGIQYWASNYFLEVIGASYKKVTWGFSFVSITGPVLGAFSSSFLINMVGGIESPNALLFCTMISFLCSCVALPLTIFDNFFVLAL